MGIKSVYKKKIYFYHIRKRIFSFFFYTSNAKVNHLFSKNEKILARNFKTKTFPSSLKYLEKILSPSIDLVHNSKVNFQSISLLKSHKALCYKWKNKWYSSSTLFFFKYCVSPESLGLRVLNIINYTLKK